MTSFQIYANYSANYSQLIKIFVSFRKEMSHNKIKVECLADYDLGNEFDPH